MSTSPVLVDPRPAGGGFALEPPDAPAPRPALAAQAELTIRAVLTGMLVGGSLSLCNIYAGLKVGWGFNMSITAGLLAFGFWSALRPYLGRPFGVLENNINQTAASAAASISSAGLVSAMPALALLTGQTLSYPALVFWTFSISMVGVVVAVGLRRQMLVVDKLPFASGMATAETLQQMYARGEEALARVRHLLGGALVACGMKLVEHLAALPKIGLPGALKLTPAAGSAAPGTVSLYNLGFALDPTLMMIAVGSIIGFRAGLSLMLGAVVAWGFVAPWAVELGWAKAGKPDALWFGAVNPWLLWPGVAMMVTASLTSFAFSWRSIVASIRGTRGGGDDEGDGADNVKRSVFLGAIGLALVASVFCQVAFFGIRMHIAVLAVLLTFALAVVAGRVTGETSITPVGPMGKVTQLIFGVLSPGDAAANLMSANVTGGAASQTGDLLHDLKAGLILGASPRRQAIAQIMGVAAGAIAGCAGYLLIVRDPKVLLTPEWPAPAVAAWKAVAEVFMKGIDSMPQGGLAAMCWGGGIGIALALLEKLPPERVRRWVPSPASFGLAFVIPAYNSASMFLGAAIGLLLMRFTKSWSERFLVATAAGMIAGESLTGVGLIFQKMMTM